MISPTFANWMHGETRTYNHFGLKVKATYTGVVDVFNDEEPFWTCVVHDLAGNEIDYRETFDESNVEATDQQLSADWIIRLLRSGQAKLVEAGR